VEPNTDHFHTPVLVTGIPRSGTSMVAGTLAQCGAWTGTTVEGFYEHADLREHVVKFILKGLGADPLGVKKLPDVPATAELKHLADYVRTTINNDGYKGERWMYKGCKMALLWPFFTKAFPEAQWVVVRRPHEEIVQSCLRTPFMNQHSTDHDFWEEWCAEYEWRLTGLILTSPRTIVVTCSKWSTDADYVEDIVTRLGLTYDEARVKAWINPDKLRRK